MINTIEEMLIEHLKEPKDTLACYECFNNESWEDRDPETGELKGFITYFFLDFEYDMIICAATDNKFSKSQWRILRDTLNNRVKPIRIQSDRYNMALRKGAKRFGGYFTGGDIYLPIIKEQ